MADETLTFHWADYLVFAAFLVFSTFLGIIIGFRNRKNANSKDFLMGGGDMHWIPTALSMQASFLSAIFILTTPVEIYSFGITYCYLGISYFLACPIIAHIYLPIFYRLKLVSAYAYLEMRFNRTVRVAGSLTFCVMVLLYMSVVLYTPAIALAQVTGLSIYISIPVCGVVCVIYTFVGGMKATIWNDFIQMIVIVIGLIVIIIFGSIEGGNMTDIWNTNEAGGRLNFTVFDPDPTIRTSFWTHSVGGTFVNVTLYASSQTIIQKFLSVKNVKNAQKSIYLASFTSLVFLVLVVLVGLCMYDYYELCDPVKSGKVEKPDQMLPLYVMELLGHLPGLPGLFIATTFSAALSSISGSLNALSAVTLYDFVKPIYLRTNKRELSDKISGFLSRFLTLVYGVFVIAMGFVAQFLGDTVLQVALSIFGFVGGPVLALLSLGMFFPFVNSYGALAGLITSLGFCSWIAIGAIIEKVGAVPLQVSVAGCEQPNATLTTAMYSSISTTDVTTYIPAPSPGSSDILWIYRVSYMYYSLIAMAVMFIVAIPISLITGRSKNTPARLTYDWGRYFCCYCSKSCKTCLKCGAVDDDDDDDDDDSSSSSHDDSLSTSESNTKSHRHVVDLTQQAVACNLLCDGVSAVVYTLQPSYTVTHYIAGYSAHTVTLDLRPQRLSVYFTKPAIQKQTRREKNYQLVNKVSLDDKLAIAAVATVAVVTHDNDNNSNKKSNSFRSNNNSFKNNNNNNSHTNNGFINPEKIEIERVDSIPDDPPVDYQHL